jgi:hypothetical protein
MRKTFLSLTALGAVCAPMLLAAPAQAQATRTWVSGVGDDANPCSRTAPCKTFAGAISKTATNGEINCLDPGGFGAVTITKSINIDCHEIYASILASGFTGVIINIAAGNVNDPLRSVRLRNININGAGSSGSVGTRTGINGIRIDAALSVSIEDCLITDFTQRGIFDQRSIGGKLTITNTIVRNNTIGGLVVSPSSGSTRIDVSADQLYAEGNGVGMAFNNGAKAMVNRSLSSNNTGSGIEATATLGTTEVTVDGSISSSNATGLLQAGGGVMRISNSDINFNTSNGTSGVINSFRNSRFAGNGGVSNTVFGGATSETGQQ